MQYLTGQRPWGRGTVSQYQLLGPAKRKELQQWSTCQPVSNSDRHLRRKTWLMVLETAENSRKSNRDTFHLSRSKETSFCPKPGPETRVKWVWIICFHEETWRCKASAYSRILPRKGIFDTGLELSYSTPWGPTIISSIEVPQSLS